MATFTEEESKRYEEILKRRMLEQFQQAMTHPQQPDRPVSSKPTAMMMTDRGMRQMPASLQALMGFGAAQQDILANVGEMTGAISPERYRAITEANAPFRQQAPVSSFLGETVATTAPAMAVGGPAAVAGRFAGFGAPVTRAVTEGATSGALVSPPGERTFGAITGGGFSVAVPATSGALSRMARGADMTEGGRLLTQRGVTLTPGQLDPRSNWAMIEESMQRIPIVGTKVAKARQRGMTEAQTLIAQDSAPPGFRITPSDDVQDLADQLVRGYKEAYDIGKGYPMRPVILREAEDIPLGSIFTVPATAVADDASIQYANRFLANELSFIKNKGSKLTSDDLFKVRSNIRQEIRNINKSQAAPFKASELLSQVEDSLSEAIQSQLPPNVLSEIARIDRQYRNYKVFERAINKAADRPEGFTPSEFARAIREVTNDMTYATGGGPMRDTSRALSETFPGRQPQTGGSLPGIGAAGLLGTPAYLSGLYGEAPLSEGLRRIVGGSTRPQRAVQAQIDEFERRFGRKLSNAEKEAIKTVIRSGAGVSGAEQRGLLMD